MNLATLKELDAKTANGILAAAVLTSNPNPGTDLGLVKTYSKQAADLLADIRQQLNINDEDSSSDAHLLIQRWLSNAIKDQVLKGAFDAPLKRAGQTGRLPPSMYRVEEKPGFQKIFRPFGTTRANVEDAVRFPDDYQHLMTELADAESKDVISLFMKKVVSKGRDSFWLIVQTHRVGITQIVQSAWRIYTDVIDLANADRPIDVLKAFIKVFGIPMRIRGKEVLFLEAEEAPKREALAFQVRGDLETFGSVSFTSTTNPDIVQVGIAYSINIPNYRSYLKEHGVA
jgi:hypothetical protein